MRSFPAVNLGSRGLQVLWLRRWMKVPGKFPRANRRTSPTVRIMAETSDDGPNERAKPCGGPSKPTPAGIRSRGGIFGDVKHLGEEIFASCPAYSPPRVSSALQHNLGHAAAGSV